MFHDRTAVSSEKVNMSWALLGVTADEGMSRYTEIIRRIIFQIVTTLYFLINKITMLPAIVTANSGDFGIGLANFKRIGASSGCRLCGRECNEIQSKNRVP
jgi:hypothetical protein